MAIAAEEARRQLDAVAVPDAHEAAKARARKVFGDAGRVVSSLTYADDRPGGSRRKPLSDARIGRWLDEASERQRRKVWRTLHPQLADLLERWWTGLGRLEPYPEGYQRRAFRAPHHPELTRVARVQALRSIQWATVSYGQPIAWFATWAAHLGSYGTGIGRLLATAMVDGDDEVRSILHVTARGDHPIGRVGRDLVAALLGTGDPRDLAVVEQLLLAAGRQEGLRSVVLEAADVAHPDAFRTLLATVREQELTRFASVIRAVGVWFGITVDVRDRADVDALIADAVRLLDDRDARAAAIAGPDPSRVHLALWCAAFHDGPAAVDLALPLLADDDADRRLAAATLMHATQLPAARAALLERLADADLRVVAVAADAIRHDHRIAADVLAAPIRLLLSRLPGKVEVDVGVLRSAPVTLDPADLVDHLAFRTPAVDVRSLDDVLDRASSTGRGAYVRGLAADPAFHRARLLDLLADRSGYVRDTALDALAGGPPPTVDEAVALEALLSRKAAALRRGVIGLLLRQADASVLATADRLRAGSAPQRAAATELLRELVTAGRGGPEAADRVEELSADAATSQDERRLLATVTRDAPAPLAEPAALVDHAARTPAALPTGTSLDLGELRAGTDLVVTSLDAWLAEHRDVEVTVRRWDGELEAVLVGDLRHLAAPVAEVPWAEQDQHLPLPELLDAWWERTAPQLGGDGVEPALALAGLTAWTAIRDPYAVTGYWTRGRQDAPRWLRSLSGRLLPEATVDQLGFGPVAAALLRWLVVREVTSSGLDPLLEVATAALGAVPAAATRQLPSLRDVLTWSWQDPPLPLDWRDAAPVAVLAVLVGVESLRPEVWTPAQRGRLWALARATDEPHGSWTPERGHDDVDDGVRRRNAGAPPRVPRRPVRRSPTVATCVRAVEDGVADRADLVELLVGERLYADGQLATVLRDTVGGQPLAELTRRRPNRLLQEHPWVAEVVDGVRDAIVDTEAARGELPTPVSGAARQLRSVVGADAAVRLLTALGDAKLIRGWSWGQAVSRPEVLSHLLQVAFPAPDDTPATFAELARAAGLREKRLLELAVYAPQWAPAVEHTLGWDGLTDAVHWLHAHTKDDRWSVDADVRAEWTAATHERTRLTADELVRGDVDVAWFERVLTTVGDDRFDRLLKVGKLAAAGGGHKRAELFAQALRGRVDRDELDRRIDDKRHQDAVRALGLLPLPDDRDRARAEVLARYEQLEAWRRGSSRFGQQRRASEALAADVATANLARTAGYADPQRLRWAMEAEAIRDLAAGPVTVVEDDVTVTLSLAADGVPELTVRRGDRALKSVPKAVAKRPAVVELKERVRRLRDQTRRMRTSLEQAMVRGDRFATHELAEQLAHPTLAPMLRALVLVDADGQVGAIAGDGWHGPEGEDRRPADGPVAVAHPVDLLASGEWDRWQHRLFADRVRQPFKQVFRELYVPTAAERDGAVRSDRYAGHQLESRRAIALLGGRGWVADRDFGALRTFHDAGVTVRVEVLDGWLTPAEAADTMLRSVSFTPVASWEPLPLAEVEPRLFSEAMRDLDLVVSVAHSGGVDPEASASTVEVRAALVRETADLLGLDNVEVTDHHALVAGTIASYSVHLGSGTVHRRPGNAVCIVPVGAQHRGRLFLPFVDDDPRTAEVVSKVLLLARDGAITDPTILEQLRA